MDLAAIFFTHPVGQMLFVALDDFASFIRAATVDDDVFEIRILLIEYRQNRLFKKLSLIERRGNDAEFCRHILELRNLKSGIESLTVSILRIWSTSRGFCFRRLTAEC